MKIGQIFLFALSVFLVPMLASTSAQQGSPSRTGWISDESCVSCRVGSIRKRGTGVWESESTLGFANRVRRVDPNSFRVIVDTL